MSTEDLVCADCGTPLKNGHSKCPKCGSGNKSKTVKGRIDFNHSKFRARQKNKTIPGNVLDFKYRKKIARGSGRPARDELTIDRRDKKWTTKRHRVKELINGVWKVCYDNMTKCRAKRRGKEVK